MYESYRQDSFTHATGFTRTTCNFINFAGFRQQAVLPGARCLEHLNIDLLSSWTTDTASAPDYLAGPNCRWGPICSSTIHPIAAFRRRFLPQIEDLFVQ